MTKHLALPARRPTGVALLVLTSLGLAAGGASAQVVPSLDVGTHTIDQRGAPALGAAAIAPALRVSLPLASVDASALQLFSVGGPARDPWTGSLATALTTPRTRAFRGELGVLTRRDLGAGFSTVTSTQLEARVRYDRARFGLWASQATGTATTSEGGRHFGGLGTGFWARIRGVTITTSVGWIGTRDSVQGTEQFDTTVFQGWQYDPKYGIDTVKDAFGRDSIRQYLIRVDTLPVFGDTTMTRSTWGLDALAYTDLEGGIHWARRNLELGARAGRRVGLARRDGNWASASGSLWLSRRAALVMSVGRDPEDVTRGIPARRYASLGMRLARTPFLGFGGHAPPVVMKEPDGATTTEFDVALSAPGAYTLRVRAPGAREVEIMGSFTEWRPMPLRLVGNGRWEVTLPIPAGVHQINLRMDRGAWGAPPGLTTAVDGFSGTVGVLVIP